MMKKIFLSILLVAVILPMSCLVCSAAFTSDLPNYVKMSGGAWFEAYDSDFGNCTVVFPIEFKNDCFAFSLSDSGLPSGVLNVTNSTVYGTVYTSDGSVYSARASRFSQIEIQTTTSGYTSSWVALNPDVVALDNSNMRFLTYDKMYMNNAVPDYDKYIIVILTVIAFSEFLGLCAGVLRRGRR